MIYSPQKKLRILFFLGVFFIIRDLSLQFNKIYPQKSLYFYCQVKSDWDISEMARPIPEILNNFDEHDTIFDIMTYARLPCIALTAYSINNVV